MKNDKDVFIEKYGDAIVSIDFGHTDDFNTEKKRIFKDKRLLSPK